MGIAFGVAFFAYVLWLCGKAALPQVYFLLRRKTAFDLVEGEVVGKRTDPGEYQARFLAVRFMANGKAVVVEREDITGFPGAGLGKRLPVWYCKDKPTWIVLADYQQSEATAMIARFLLVLAIAVSFCALNVFPQ
jgi:hypothetical protein